MTLNWGSLLNQIRKWLSFAKRRKPPAIVEPAPAPIEVPVVVPEPPKISSHQADVLRFERRRRKFDKFVQPKGERPKREPRQTQELKPKPVPKPVVDDTIVDKISDAELFIADRHHEDRDGENVLYKEAEIYGEFNFRDTILQQLDRYFFYLKRMRKHDPSAYGFYRQVGATLLPYIATGSDQRWEEREKEDWERPLPPLAPWFNATRPAFGCFAYGADPETEKYEELSRDLNDPQLRVWVPKFMYFKKFKEAPPEVQPMSGGDIYVVTVWWDRPASKNKHGIPREHPVFVSRDGKVVRALKSVDTKFITIQSKGKGKFEIPNRAWRFPDEGWSKENRDPSPERYFTRLFLETIHRHERSHLSMVRVAATRNGSTAVFSVNAHRTAYFFQDRDIHLTEDGSRKRIFHVVRPHVRADGTVVKMHFRGERSFTWAGYQINITIPGRDHIDINEVDIGCIDGYWQKRGTRYVNMPQFGKRLADMMRNKSIKR